MKSMNWLRYTLWALFYLAAGEAAANESAFNFNPRLQAAYHDIQKLRLDNARQVLAREKQQNPGNGFIPYLETYADLLYFLVTDDQEEFGRLQTLQDQRLQAISKLPGDSPYQRMLLAEGRLHRAFMKFRFGNRISGCWDIIRADRLLSENKKRFPGFIPHLKALGLLHVLIGSVPEEYTWVTRLIGLKGNIREGLSELQQVQQSATGFEREAHVMILLLQAYVLGADPSVIREVKALPEKEPDNLLFHFLAVSVLMKEGRGEEALSIVQKAPQTGAYLHFPFLAYMKGELLLQKGAYPAAFAQYARFQEQTKGTNFVKDSYFKQFLCKWLNDESASGDFFRQIPKQGTLHTEPDQHAQRFYELFKTTPPADEQKLLFRARYAADGGYLARALAILGERKEADFTGNRSRAEFQYRKGRILQESGQVAAAIPLLKRVLVLSEGLNYYEGASAALQLGYVYKEAGQPDTAARYFRKAMTFKKHEYKNSIDNKARAALTQLGKE